MEIEGVDISLLSHFVSISDPRRNCGKLHRLEKILTLTVLAIIAGGESWVDIEEFGKCHEEWLSTFMELENGIPSHDTIGRIFSILDPDEFQKCFISWVETLRKPFAREIVSVDGKTLRRSFDKANGKLPFHIVSAWANENGLSLGQQQVIGKSNEITAIPELLKVLALKGAIVTIDAMGCQKNITKQIRKKNADYVLALKDNQGNLHNRAINFFKEQAENHFKDASVESFHTSEKGHGRFEERDYYFSTKINCMRPFEGWSDLASIGMVVARRTVNGETTTHTRYYISSLKEKSVTDFARAVRVHWGIENKLHWVLDVCMHEDLSRVRKDYAAQNFAALRKIALNLIKLDPIPKKSFRLKKYRASIMPEYALSVLINKNFNNNN
jgi:predicted transposase YbfD/YdcC